MHCDSSFLISFCVAPAHSTLHSASHRQLTRGTLRPAAPVRYQSLALANRPSVADLPRRSAPLSAVSVNGSDARRTLISSKLLIRSFFVLSKVQLSPPPSNAPFCFQPIYTQVAFSSFKNLEFRVVYFERRALAPVSTSRRLSWSSSE